MRQGKKSVVIAIVALVIVLLAATVLYFVYRPQAAGGSKEVTIHVIDDQNSVTTYDVKTDAKYLQGAMEDADGLKFSGKDSDYGLMVDTVNGLRADYDLDGAYWGFLVNDEYCNYGMNEQPINNKDVVTIQYTLAE